MIKAKYNADKPKVIKVNKKIIRLYPGENQLTKEQFDFLKPIFKGKLTRIKDDKSGSENESTR